MEIKFLKSGKYSIDPAKGPLVVCKEDEIEDLPEEYANVLIQIGWAEEFERGLDEPEEEEEIEEEEEEEEGEEEEDNEPENLQEYVDSLPEDMPEDQKKKLIQDYGVVNFDHKASRSKSIENMISELQEIEDNLEEDEE